MSGRPWTKAPALGLFGPASAGQTLTAAARAEALGFGSLWIAEDYFYPSAFPLAAAAAAVTKSLVVATGVVNPYTRHPALLAMETATLSGLAPGRFILGLGSSTRHWIQEQMGIPFVAPLRTLEECIAIVRRLLAGKAYSFVGQRFALTDVALNLPPPDPAVPIFLGVKGPKMLELAGRLADGVILSILTSPGHVRYAREAVSASRASAGLPAVFPLLAFILVSVDEQAGAARDRMRPTLARYLGSLHGQRFLEDAGISERDTELFREALLRNTSAEHLVSDRLLDTFTVSGTPDDCRASLARFAAAGLDAPAFLIPPAVDFEPQLRLIAETLIPAWNTLKRQRSEP